MFRTKHRAIAHARTSHHVQWVLTSLGALLCLLSSDLYSFVPTQTVAQRVVTEIDSLDSPLPPIVRFIRVFGGNDESLPPVLLVNQRSPDLVPVVGERSVRIEFDIQASVPPALYFRFVHCRADWTEDNNTFLNDVVFTRSSNINWQPSASASHYYSYRGSMTVPNETVKISYAGNWKVKLMEYGNDTTVYAESRFFALDCAAECNLDINSDFYEPSKRASPAALSLDAAVTSNLLISDLNLHTAVFYRLNRWNEPLVSTGFSSLNFNSKNRIRISSSIGGIASAAKRFRLNGIPAENDYRILDMANLAQFPRSKVPVRTGLTDLRRNGSILFRADDAAMKTTGLSSYDDDYVPVEFVLDPENRPSIDDVFVVGSFNNWKPTKEWQMQYVEKDRLYILRHWVKRARHNYAYATGRCNADNEEVENISFEEFEGNNVSAGHTFMVFIYFRDPSYGGYDSIVAVAAGSIFHQIRR